MENDGARWFMTFRLPVLVRGHRYRESKATNTGTNIAYYVTCTGRRVCCCCENACACERGCDVYMYVYIYILYAYTHAHAHAEQRV